MGTYDEIRLYLDFLLNHEDEPGHEACAACDALHSVLDALRTQIFSAVVYPEIVAERSAARGIIARAVL